MTHAFEWILGVCFKSLLQKRRKKKTLGHVRLDSISPVIVCKHFHAQTYQSYMRRFGFPMKLIMMLLSVNRPHDRKVARHVSQRAHYISLVQHSNNVYTCWAVDNDLAPDTCRTIVFTAKHHQEDKSTGSGAAWKPIRLQYITGKAAVVWKRMARRAFGRQRDMKN